VQVQVHFCTRDPNPTHAKLGLDAGFIFHPWVHPKQEKKPETRKKPEARKKPENPLKKLKTPKTPKNLKETHLQNPTGTQIRPKTRRVWVRVPNFTRGFGCQIQPDYIFLRVGCSVDPTQTRPVAISSHRYDSAALSPA
jgi:hypothetical protein